MDTYLEVRKAYRFLHDFHKRLRSNQLMLIKDIDSTMTIFVSGGPLYNSMPSFSQRFKINWMSDYFPLMNHTLLFASRKQSTCISIDTYIDEEISEHLYKGQTDFDAKSLSPADKTIGFMDFNMYKFKNLPEDVKSLHHIFSHEISENYDEISKIEKDVVAVSSQIEFSELEDYNKVLEKLSEIYLDLIRFE